MFSKTKIPFVILLTLPRKETKGKYCFSLCNTQKDIKSRQFISIVTVTYCIFLSLLNSLSKDVKERSLEQEKTRFQLCHFGLHSYKEVAIWSRKKPALRSFLFSFLSLYFSGFFSFLFENCRKPVWFLLSEFWPPPYFLATDL